MRDSSPCSTMRQKQGAQKIRHIVVGNFSGSRKPINLSEYIPFFGTGERFARIPTCLRSGQVNRPERRPKSRPSSSARRLRTPIWRPVEVGRGVGWWHQFVGRGYAGHNIHYSLYDVLVAVCWRRGGMPKQFVSLNGRLSCDITPSSPSGSLSAPSLACVALQALLLEFRC